MPASIPRPAARAVAALTEIIWNVLRLTKNPLITREIINLIGSDNRFSITRAREELGYEPATGYEEGLGSITEYLISLRK